MLSLLTKFGVTACSGGGFLGFPHWYEYLNCQTLTDGQGHTLGQSPQITGINDIWLIVAAIIEIMLRIAVLAAVGFVVWGGVQYMTSQGDPGKTAKARGTIINALAGLAISILSATLVAFVAGSFK